MKLIVQADDYAMTDAIAEGILKCARDGILTQTGLMTNGPHALYYAERMRKEFPHVCIIQEINLVSGRPLSNPKDIPTLVDENGRLIRSVYHRQMDKTSIDHVTFEDSYREIDAQVRKYIEIMGHVPYAFGLHSYHNPNMMRAMEAIREKYQITNLKLHPKTKDIQEGYWHWYGISENQHQPVDIVNDYFLKGKCDWMTGHEKEEDYIAEFHCHAAFIDKELWDMSTLTLTRLSELEFLCSEELKRWIRENSIELTEVGTLLEMR